METNLADMSEATKGIYANRLKGLARKMLNHSEHYQEKLWEHHSTSERQERCKVCFDYSYQFNRWNAKWWELQKKIGRLTNASI